LTARQFYGCIGPSFADKRLLNDGTGNILGFSMPATTTAGASPPRGAYWLKMVDTSTTYQILWGARGMGSILTYVWDCFVFRVEGSLGASADDPIVEIPVAGGDSIIKLWQIRSSADKFQIRLTKTGADTVVATGATEFDHDTTISCRLELNGTTARVWLNDGGGGGDLLEIDVAYTGTRQAQGPRMSPISTSGVEHYLCQWGCFGSNSEADRPALDAVVDMLEQNGQGPDDDYGDEVATTAGRAEPADVALDGSDLVDTSIYWQGDAARDDIQNVTLTTVSPAGAVVEGAMWRGCGANTSDLKNASWNAQLIDHADHTDREIIAGTVLTSTAWVGRTVVFDTPPDAGDWNSFALADLEAGVEDFSTADVNDLWSALVVEICSVDDDPPPSEGPDAGGQPVFASANVMRV